MYAICKLLYIAVFSLLSAAPPYLPLYYRDVLHFSSNQIGLVLAIAPFVESVACPIWSLIADKRPKQHGYIMAGTSFLGGSAIMGIMMIGHSVSSDEPLLSYRLSGSALVGVTSAFALAFAFFTLPNISLVDGAVMKILGPDKLLYGEQRLWGSVSAGFTILLVGQLLSITKNYDSVFLVFGISTILFVICSSLTKVNRNEFQSIPELNEPELGRETDASTEKLLIRPINTYHSLDTTSHYVDLFKPNTNASAHTMREEADEVLSAMGHVNLGLSLSRIASVDQAMTSGLVQVATEGIPTAKNVFKSVRVLTFLTTTLFFGVVLSIIQNFLFLFLSRDLLMPASWIGWTGPTTGSTELLCFCFSKQLTEKFGVTRMVIIAHTVIILRCLAYTVLQPDSLFTNVCALLLQTLHGIGFGIFWATAVSEMDGFFPPEQRSVAQGILGALYFGLGTGLGALTGGFMYQFLGAVSMFRITAIIATVNISIFYIGRLDRFK